MKVTRNREVIVGLSVILTLTIVLIGVVVWRFTRPNPRPEKEIARLDELNPELHGKEIEARRPTFAETTPTPAAETPHEQVEQNPWVKHAPENHAAKHEEKAPKAINVATPPNPAFHDRYEVNKEQPPSEQRHGQQQRSDEPRYQAAREPAVLSPEASDDRYAVPSRAEAPRPMVIQVSGDAPSAPSPASRGMAAQPGDYATAGRDADMSGNRRRPTLPPNEVPPAASNYAQPSDGAPAVPPAAANYSQNYAQPNNAQPNNAQPNYGAPNNSARDPRGNYESTGSAQPTDNSGYPGPGYNSQGGAPRREEYQQPTVAQNPLRSDGMYEVLPNDSYWTISQRVYGSGAYFRALAEVNRGKAARPDRLSPGLMISTPPVAQLEKDYPDFCPRPNRREAVRNRSAAAVTPAAYNGGRTYVVQEGDTVWTIARNELGKVTRWSEIVQLNRDTLGKDYDYLTPGMKLVLPPAESQTGDRTARRNDTAAPATRY